MEITNEKYIFFGSEARMADVCRLPKFWCQLFLVILFEFFF